MEFDRKGKVIAINEKPSQPKSRYAVTGLYFMMNSRRKSKKNYPFKGELEITTLNNLYLDDDELQVETMGRGMAWLDTGTHDTLHEAGSFVRTIEHRQGLKICCPEEIAWRSGWIDNKQLVKLSQPLLKSGYGEYLMTLLKESDADHELLDKNLKD